MMSDHISDEWLNAYSKGQIEEPHLAEVRHDRGRKAPKSFRINSGNRQVCTTFAIEFEPFGKADAELL